MGVLSNGYIGILLNQWVIGNYKDWYKMYVIMTSQIDKVLVIFSFGWTWRIFLLRENKNVENCEFWHDI